MSDDEDDMPSTMMLHVWEPDGGGVSREWCGPLMDTQSSWWFFVFGRHGGGWAPLRRLDERERQRTEAAAAAARDRFGVEVEIRYAAPAAQ